jgi:dUTP pyrophosphatase
MSKMDASVRYQTYYTLELFPTDWQNCHYYTFSDGGKTLERNNENAGFDLFVAKDTEVRSGDVATLLDLGVKARMTKHWWSCQYGSPVECKDTCHFWLAPRSSIWKSGVRMANSLGVIDRSYRGTLMAAVLPNTSEKPVSIQAGVRVAQILAPDMGWIRYVHIKNLTELDETSRGEGGFGSTGR